MVTTSNQFVAAGNGAGHRQWRRHELARVAAQADTGEDDDAEGARHKVTRMRGALLHRALRNTMMCCHGSVAIVSVQTRPEASASFRTWVSLIL